jgi:hypothetical protein
MRTETAEPWALDHAPRILMQMEVRPGPAMTDGTRWTERRLTGRGVALCSCGYNTGLIPRAELPEVTAFVSGHKPLTCTDVI